MTKIKNICFAAVLSLGLGFGTWCQATPTLYSPETWANLNGWTATDDGTASAAGTLNVLFNVPAVPGASRIYTDGLSGGAPSTTFANNQDYTLYPYYPDLAATFTMRYDQLPPAGVAMYFYSGTSGREWVRYFDLSGITSPGTWYNMSANFAWDPALWGPLLGGVGLQADFIADLADVDRLGFYVSMNPAPGDQNVEFDNLMFTIPEPETIFLLSTVFLAMGITFRGRIGGLWAKMRGFWSRT